MEHLQELDEKYYQYLLHMLDTKENVIAHDFLTHSKVKFVDNTSHRGDTSIGLRVTADPAVFKKYQNNFSVIEYAISTKFSLFTKIRVDSVEIVVDLSKFQVIENRIIFVLTPWEEINLLQKKIIDNFEHSSDTIDFQNLGNTARTIMEKLARQVFDPKIHVPKLPDIDISGNKFKNQLHTFIDYVLSGSKNLEFRKLAEAIIEIVERSIDFMNSITHKLNGSRSLAEVCVISTISAVSVIKLINDLK